MLHFLILVIVQKATFFQQRKFYLLCTTLVITLFLGWKASTRSGFSYKELSNPPVWTAPKEFLSTVLQREAFDPDLYAIQTIEAAHQYLETKAVQTGINTQQNAAFVAKVDAFVKQRFFHAYATYAAQDHYLIAWLGENIWSHLHGVIEPDDILKSDKAMCSQQTIVLMDLLKRQGYWVRKVGFQGHFACEVYYDGAWHFHDTDLEADFSHLSTIPSVAQLVQNPEMAILAYSKSISAGRITPATLTEYLQQPIEIGATNLFPAPRLLLLHLLLKWIEQYGWVVSLAVVLLQLLALMLPNIYQIIKTSTIQWLTDLLPMERPQAIFRSFF